VGRRQKKAEVKGVRAVRPFKKSSREASLRECREDWDGIRSSEGGEFWRVQSEGKESGEARKKHFTRSEEGGVGNRRVVPGRSRQPDAPRGTCDERLELR
jgi:hypothetical protein